MGAPPSIPPKGTPRHSERPGGAKALIGLTIGERYRIERLLGEGGMGAVYQAEHTLMRKRMAIKVLHPEMTRLPEVVARFEREAMAAAHIDHPHVVTATDFGKLLDGSFFLALEFVEGASLREIIAAGRLDLGRALHIGRQIASALSRAHALKIVHRDLKPENVMLVERDGDPDFVKVLDFGIAKVQIGELTEHEPSVGPGQQVLTQAGMVYGTPEYMAPEQALGQPVDARADLYALGVILYEMLTGVRPFDAESKVALLGMQVTAPVPAMVRKNAEANVPPEVEALVSRLLAKEASERLADARELIDGITAILIQLAAAGRIDPRYAPSPTSGMLTNPGILSGIGSAPEFGRASLTGANPRAANAVAPSAAKGPLASKSWIVAAAAGTLGIIVLVATILVVIHGRSSTTDGADGGTATSADGSSVTSDPTVDQKVQEAMAMIERGDYGSGIKRLEELGESAQGREDVHRALLTAYSQTDRSKDAMREAGAVLRANPNLDLPKEVKLRVEIRDTALKEGSKDPNQKGAADEAFVLLENQMGTVGWDDLYDIAYGTSGAQYPKAAARAKAMLARGDRQKMSPALQVAVDLTGNGASCAAKNNFDRAARDGDERALAILKTLVAPRLVGHWKKQDVLGCIHEGSLTKTIAALEERVRAQKKK
ncbi:Serine/threonine protein kinase PrkC, regulator of stationary phase [Labilithrix luteola]|uniref:Serine/threonine protein kinase PrkC, regulator of stationary phase n=2 Tax=Labilithrix luteola TaxID=1391654 RepID=A0A0K1PSM7_9BACT|nr:Serine/threonine protein kinase PrkC, regulator of stationary phase [Labilithrix luteola]